MEPGRYVIVGPGRLGLSLGATLVDSGAGIELTFIGRRTEPPSHPLFERDDVSYSTVLQRPAAGACLLLAVPDAAVAATAAKVARLGEARPETAALHLSGALAAEALAPLAGVGYATGSLHPLAAVADPQQGAARLRGAYFAFEGGEGAKPAAQAIVDAGGGTLLELQAADKARYHAACVFASNYVVTCAAVAVRLLAEAAGISESEAERALRPLWEGAIANLEEPGLPAALTGPVRRGDLETIEGHIEALDRPTRELYVRLALGALKVARSAGLDEPSAQKVESALREIGAGDLEKG